MRRGPGTPYRRLSTLRHLLQRDRAALLEFLRQPSPKSRTERLRLVARCLRSTHHLRGYHSLSEMLEVGSEILRRSGNAELVVVECGVGKGSSTCKLSHFVRAAGGQLHAFDSFRGLPANEERHRQLDGRPVRFRAGAFHGRLREVTRNLERYGAAERVTLHKGWFEETLPHFDRRFDVALLDVDLLASTRSCLLSLLPLRKPDGVIFTQDGHLRAIVEFLADARSWRELNSPMPTIEGLSRKKLLRLDFAAEALQLAREESA